MNIETLLQKANLFTELAIENGLKRDIEDYQVSLQQSQNRNLIFMNDINTRLYSKLEKIYNSSLVDDLGILIKNGKPFTERNYITELDDLSNNTNLNANSYYSSLLSILQSLLGGLKSNLNEITKLTDVIEKYSISNEDINSIEDYYPICLKFNDEETTRGLKNLQRSLRIWNITLLNYQTLITSKSPEQIKVQSVNDGCIEFVLEYGWDVAEKFAGVIDTFSTYYVTYLALKNSINKIFGDKAIISKKVKDSNEKTIKLMFDDMENNLKQFILEQVKDAKSKDIDIKGDGSDSKKIELVAKSVINHFLKGNEIKFLMPFEDIDEEDIISNSDDSKVDVTKRIRDNTSKAKKEYEILTVEDKKLLLEKYSVKDIDFLDKKK